MILVAVLLCSIGVEPTECTITTAADVMYFEAPLGACVSVGAQSVVAGQAGDRTGGMVTKIICNPRHRKDK